MQLVEVKESEKDLYNQFAVNSVTGSFLQSWEWGEWQKALGREVLRYWILEDVEGKAGTMQLIKMPLPFGKYYWYCPYGPIVSEKSPQILQEKFSDSVFVRTESKNFLLPTTHYPLPTKSKNIQPGKTLIVDLNKNEEQLLSEMHPKTRYNIRLAEKHGVKIEDEFALTIGKGLYAQEAIELIAQTAKRHDYKAQNKDYFEKLISFFAVQNSQADLRLHIYKALYNKELLASAVMIDFGKTRTYLFGGSSDQNKNVMAPYLLHWRAMLEAKTAGLFQYDFWGIETSAGQLPGFVKFKLGFSSSAESIRQYAGAYDYIISPWQYKLYRILRFVNRVLKRG